MFICNILGSLRSLAIWFESYLVANPEHFSHDDARMR